MRTSHNAKNVTPKVSTKSATPKLYNMQKVPTINWGSFPSLTEHKDVQSHSREYERRPWYFKYIELA